MMRNEEPFHAFTGLDDMEALEGIKEFPVRVKCATLGWTTLAKGLEAKREGRDEVEISTEDEE
jgi:nitrogen fixation NifU-like protein